MPYFLKDNKDLLSIKIKQIEDDLPYFESNRQRLINYAKYETLKKDSNYYDVDFDTQTGGVKAIHKGHILHENDKEQRFFKELTKDGKGLTSTQLEISCQDNLFRMGHSAILRDESQKRENGDYMSSLDLELNSEVMDIRSIISPNHYGRSLCDKNKQLGRVERASGYVGNSVCLYFHNKNIYNIEKLKQDAEWYKKYIVECGSVQRIKHIYIVINGNKELIKIDI